MTAAQVAAHKGHVECAALFQAEPADGGAAAAADGGSGGAVAPAPAPAPAAATHSPQWLHGHRMAMKYALMHLVKNPRVSNLFRDHRHNGQHEGMHVFVKVVDQANFTGTRKQIRRQLIAAITSPTAWAHDPDIGGSLHAFEDNIPRNEQVEEQQAWLPQGIGVVEEQLENPGPYAHLFPDQHAANQQAAQAAREVALQLHGLIGHLPTYKFAIPDYVNDPGNGILFITGYVAVDGNTIYGWYETGIRLG